MQFLSTIKPSLIATDAVLTMRFPFDFCSIFQLMWWNCFLEICREAWPTYQETWKTRTSEVWRCARDTEMVQWKTGYLCSGNFLLFELWSFSNVGVLGWKNHRKAPNVYRGTFCKAHRRWWAVHLHLQSARQRHHHVLWAGWRWYWWCWSEGGLSILPLQFCIGVNVFLGSFAGDPG